MISSNRLVLNSNLDNIIINSESNISLTSINSIGLYSKENDIILQSGKNNIRLGDPNASQSVILGDTFIKDFKVLLKKLQILCTNLQAEPKIYLSGGAAGAVKSQTTLMLNNIKNYMSKVVKSI